MNKLLSKIIGAIEDNDTTEQITNKIIDKHPNYFIKKLRQCHPDGVLDITYGKQALKQIRGEVSSIFTHDKGEIFSVDKSKRPYQYSIDIDQLVPPKRFKTKQVDLLICIPNIKV